MSATTIAWIVVAAVTALLSFTARSGLLPSTCRRSSPHPSSGGGATRSVARCALWAGFHLLVLSLPLTASGRGEPDGPTCTRRVC
jgi:hypothetical protein